MRRLSYIVYCLCRSRRQRNLAADISHGDFQNGMKFGSLVEGALLNIITQLVNFGPMGPLCASQIVKGVKICNAFLVRRLAERDKFGMVRDLANGLCSPNLVNFSRGSRDTRRRLASVTH